MKQMTTEQFLNHFEKSKLKWKTLKNLEVISEYHGIANKVTVRCSKDNHSWEVFGNNLITGSTSCKVCRMKERAEIFKEKLKKINPNIEVIGDYVNSTTLVEVRCTTHDHVWQTSPANLLRGHGCRVCSNQLKYSKSTFKEEVAKKQPHLTLLSDYVSVNTKIKFRCETHGYEGEAVYSKILDNTACKECSPRNKTANSHENFLKGANIDPNIELLGQYVNSETKILVRCKQCGNEWGALPGNLRRGRGCYSCRHAKIHTKARRELITEKWLNVIAELNPNLEILNETFTSNEIIEVECKLCGHSFRKHLQALRKRPTCPTCSIDGREKRDSRTTYRKNAIRYANKLQNLNPNLEILSDYLGSTKPVTVRCRVCSKEFTRTPYYLLKNPKCTNCTKHLDF